MALVTTKKMLLNAKKNGYAVGAFNCENMEMVQAIITAAENLESPVIIQTTPGTLKYASAKTFAANIYSIAKESNIPIAIHLDHGNSLELSILALRAGYTSVMYDGSQYDLEKNIKLTKDIVEICNYANVPVEGELGQLAGKEDNFEINESVYTDKNEAKRFVEETGVSSLAIGVGTQHGVYKATPKIQLELIKEINDLVSVPLVLHGASGLDEEVLKKSIKNGIAKINFATELREAYTTAVFKYLKENQNAIDPKLYGKEGRKAVVEIVEKRIRICGSVKKANIN